MWQNSRAPFCEAPESASVEPPFIVQTQGEALDRIEELSRGSVVISLALMAVGLITLALLAPG